ncbi:MAG: 4-hydroxybenzoate octaprenyltransferase [Phenylobacterium sp.]|uniref:UbiA family prenyltransferase n=1 Tax=Phenylobacterium sp. TaxID=1871053 RepID=UPI0025EC8385|nr:UbiA family prenyltransferase [Phenylobacterium sp.]MBI1200090.1 4-hydroxybenzoate octaprenyltransferase [Phenylobacterium sp.]
MSPTAPLPDAAPTNWVDRYAPAGLRPWLKLGRFDRPVGIWLLMLPGWQGIALAGAMQHHLPNPLLFFLFFLGSALMRTAGCAYNDIVDRDIDAKVARTAGRPVASGQISVKQAWALVIGASLVSLLILLMLPPLCWLLGGLSLALVAAYPFMKRITWWPQAWLGLTFNWGALMGFAAASYNPLLSDYYFSIGGPIQRTLDIGAGTNFGQVAPAALLLYAAGVVWTLGYDTIYAIQDIEDDALAGVKSSARRLGEAAPKAVAVFYAVAIVLAGAAGFTAGLGLLFYAGLAFYAAQLGAQALRVRTGDGPRALAIFQSNTWAGLILAVAIAAGASI